MRKFLLPLAVTALALGAGCVKPPIKDASGQTAEEFLKWSMDKYKAMPAFQAKVALKMTSDNSTTIFVQPRTIDFSAPNQFRVVTKMGGHEIRAISDGSKFVEYIDKSGGTASVSPAPATIEDAGTDSMRNPGVCGSLLYQFFGGAENYRQVVDTDKGGVSFGPEEPIGDETAKTVQFYGKQAYGHVKAVIGETSGHVYRLEYDAEPLVKRVEEHDGKKHFMDATESYTEIADARVPVTAFDTTLPKGIVAVESPKTPTDRPPVPIGAPAPELSVKGLDGKTYALSSFRGHVVLLDFWATWCPPCRKGLPETAHFAEIGKSKGLVVMAITGEDAGPVTEYLKKQSYTVPVFLDPDNKVSTAYNIDAIPVTAIIDPKGNLSWFNIGPVQPSEIKANLAKAGLNL